MITLTKVTFCDAVCKYNKF